MPHDLRRTLPGLFAAAAATATAVTLDAAVPGLNAATVAVVLGVLVTNLGLLRPRLRHGTHVASHRLLRIAIVLLGLQLALGDLVGLGAGGGLLVVVTVAVTFVGTRLVGRLLGLPPARSLLIATGFSICGASAIAAMSEPAEATEEDIAVAVALVTLCGSLAIVLAPSLAGPLGLSATGFGVWVGTSVHDVGQTVAAASRVPGALDTAVVFKLSRVVLLAPLVAAVALAVHRRTRTAPGGPTGRRPPPIPVFVIGFAIAVLVRSTGVLPAGVLGLAAEAQHLLLLTALFGLGTTIDQRVLRRAGGPALLVGLVSWLFVAGTAYAGVVLLGR